MYRILTKRFWISRTDLDFIQNKLYKDLLFKNHAFRIWYSDQHLQQYILKECCGDWIDQWGIGHWFRKCDKSTKPVGKQYGPNHPSKPEQGAHQESQVDEKSCSLGRCDGSRQVSTTKKLSRSKWIINSEQTKREKTKYCTQNSSHSEVFWRVPYVCNVRSVRETSIVFCTQWTGFILWSLGCVQ